MMERVFTLGSFRVLGRRIHRRRFGFPLSGLHCYQNVFPVGQIQRSSTAPSPQNDRERRAENCNNNDNQKPVDEEAKKKEYLEAVERMQKSKWKEQIDSHGRRYYWDEGTNKTQWEKPEFYVAVENQESTWMHFLRTDRFDRRDKFWTWDMKFWYSILAVAVGYCLVYEVPKYFVSDEEKQRAAEEEKMKKEEEEARKKAERDLEEGEAIAFAKAAARRRRDSS